MWASPCEKHSKGEVKSFIRSILLGLCFLSGQLSGFFLYTLSIWDPPLAAHAALSQDGSGSKGFWEEQDSLWRRYTLTFDPQGAFCVCIVSPLSQTRGEWRSLNPLLKQSFAPLCTCHDNYLKVFTRDKHWLFTLFLFLLPFQRANWRLIVNASTGALLTLISGNANKRLVVNV